MTSIFIALIIGYIYLAINIFSSITYQTLLIFQTADEVLCKDFFELLSC